MSTDSILHGVRGPQERYLVGEENKPLHICSGHEPKDQSDHFYFNAGDQILVKSSASDDLAVMPYRVEMQRQDSNSANAGWTAGAIQARPNNQDGWSVRVPEDKGGKYVVQMRWTATSLLYNHDCHLTVTVSRPR